MNTTAEVLAPGLILYRHVLDTDWEALCQFADKQSQKEWDSMYTPGTDPLTGEQGYLNRNGYFFPDEGINQMPRHCAYLYDSPDPKVTEMLITLEEAREQCVADYMEHYPVVAQSVWWKIKGHILVYPPGASLGIHADTSTDYKYGVPHPTHQIATRTVISTLTFFNNCVSECWELDGTNYMGGIVRFPYLDVEYTPKTGDLLVFPSNYMGAHEATVVQQGTRYSHVGWYCQGTPNMEVNEFALDPNSASEDEVLKTTNVYLTEPLGPAMEKAWAGAARKPRAE